ncbi:type IV toxin-antitoxin system AbiEi family antitoxin domain-containing protein [Gordonia sp. WA4-43]|uniref:type IV toxin-antitoxin system AbiEi family antitoxin domain-containing protein n=1 Tax=Gordonia sp. WA4-43 TaxID=2878678 RepID=UPI001CFAEE3D|nr:type IV toxin-antitoxin system AbiEi family antitoxin [Gordonia sp. WA4-43]UCZ89111.1 type IV toxin-antitoxin system AbiEi family antitoxin [Gordonia sp. WA4-43]
MEQTRGTPLPAVLARTALRTLRPQDATEVYAHPRPELARLADRGVLHRVAHGYYIVVPQDHVGREWLPGLEAAAAGIASTIYGADNVVVMGVSAARLHGAAPRALATAIVAVPYRHRPIDFADRPATLRFVQRDTDGLDAESIDTALGPVLVTTPEQTVLDLSRRPLLGNAETEIPAAIKTLYRRSDPDRLDELAREQRMVASLRRAEMWAAVRP